MKRFLTEFCKLLVKFLTKNLDCRAVQRSALCRSRRELSNAYFLQNLASIQPRTSPLKFAATQGPATAPPGPPSRVGRPAEARGAAHPVPQPLEQAFIAPATRHLNTRKRNDPKSRLAIPDFCSAKFGELSYFLRCFDFPR